MDTLISEKRGLTVEHYAAAKGLDPAKLARWGVTTEPNPYSGEPSVALRYLDRDDQLVRIKYRGQAGTMWDRQLGVPLILYGLHFLPKVPAGRLVLLVEGESDCHAGWTHGVLALGLPGNTTWRPEWASLLEGRPVYVWREPILPGKKVDAGKKMAEMIAADVPTAKVIQPVGFKDLCELHQRSGESFEAQFQALLDAARPIRDIVIPKPRPRSDIRVWREPVRRSPFDPGALDVEKAKAVQLDQLMRRLGFDLKRRAGEWAMRCPFHEDSRPSLRINPAKGTWYCDPCGAGGDAIAFMRRWRGLSFPDAVRAVVA
jgi:CHC2-type zinc finger protein